MYILDSLKVSRIFLEYIGADTLEYFDILFYAYYLLVGIIAFNTYRIIKDYRNRDNKDNYSQSFTKYDLAVTLAIIGVQLISMMFVYIVFIEYGIYKIMYQFLFMLAISIILFIIQSRFYTKLHGILY